MQESLRTILGDKMARDTGNSYGVLLVNLGTPDEPSARGLRKYLREFLMDPRVIDIPTVFRWILVNLIIAPFRSRKSAALYKSIWSDSTGSPLLANCKKLTSAVRKRLEGESGKRYHVELAMRYGSPSIRETLSALHSRGVDDILVIPLFPQYSSAAFGSAVARVYELASSEWNVPRLQVVEPYYADNAYLDATAAAVEDAFDCSKFERVVFSYHGLPLRHCQKSVADGSFECRGSNDCCSVISDKNRNCYRAHCVATSQGLAERLGLAKSQWEIAFQSRFGRDLWIGPFLEERIQSLPGEGAKKVLVLTPSFTADCLETLEEIGERARHSFLAMGGTEFALAPCLNSHPKWVEAIATMVLSRSPLA
jgi:ferrochelatase